MNTFRKIIAIILLVCFLCPVGILADADTKNTAFNDVSESDWFYSYVNNVCQKNIFSGIAKNIFEPNAPITRAMFVTAIGRLAEADVSAYTQSSFSDVKTSAWYAPYVEWAYKNGIASGTKDGAFSPDGSLSREQAASLIQRFLNNNDYVISTEEVKYADFDSISSYAKKPITICTNAGILTGNSDSIFNPSGNITRAEAAAVITRLEQYISNSQKDRVLNNEDQKKVNIAIKALDKPIKEEIELAKDIYSVAFSKNFAVTGSSHEILDKTFALYQNPETNVIQKESVTLMEMVAEGLFGGTKIEGEPKKYFGDKKTEITANDFLTGDIIILQSDISNADSAVMYIYDGERFSILEYEVVKETVATILAKAFASERFVVLRPSYVMHNLNNSLPYQEEELSEAQKAVVATAENYLLRGYRIQYADTRLTTWPGEYRWQIGVKAPEDYTIDEWGYLNCASFAIDVYRNAIDWQTDMHMVWHLASAGYLRPFYYQLTGNETLAQMESIEEEFYQNLEVGDIICLRRPDATGHAMLYVGNGNIIHSSGSTYNYKTRQEKYEPTVRYLQLKDLFTPAGGEKRYIFGGKTSEVAIIKPLATWDGVFPENSLKRVNNMKGIVAEKLCSHDVGKTVNTGEEMTFTYSVYNTNDYDVTIAISDEVPDNTTYISGAQKVDGNKLLWNITVPSNETVEVLYKVKVNKTIYADNSTVFGSSGKVGDVPVNCPAILIKRTLTSDEQQKLIKTAVSSEFTSENPVENANAIYNNTFSVKNILSANTPEELVKGLFEDSDVKEGHYKLKQSGNLSQMVAPSLFGGRKLYSSVLEYKAKGTWYRTRMVKEQSLIAGDIIVSFNNESYDMYLYTGNGLMDLKNGETVADTEKYLEGLLGTELYFAVIRPSAVMK